MNQRRRGKSPGPGLGWLSLCRCARVGRGLLLGDPVRSSGPVRLGLPPRLSVPCSVSFSLVQGRRPKNRSSSQVTPHDRGTNVLYAMAVIWASGLIAAFLWFPVTFLTHRCSSSMPEDPPDVNQKVSQVCSKALSGVSSLRACLSADRVALAVLVQEHADYAGVIIPSFLLRTSAGAA